MYTYIHIHIYIHIELNVHSPGLRNRCTPMCVSFGLICRTLDLEDLNCGTQRWWGIVAKLWPTLTTILGLWLYRPWFSSDLPALPSYLHVHICSLVLSGGIPRNNFEEVPALELPIFLEISAVNSVPDLQSTQEPHWYLVSAWSQPMAIPPSLRRRHFTYPVNTEASPQRLRPDLLCNLHVPGSSSLSECSHCILCPYLEGQARAFCELLRHVCILRYHSYIP